LEFALAWSRQDAKRAEAERPRRLDLCVNLEEDDDAEPSKWRSGDSGQGYSTWAAKDEPPSDEDDDDRNEDYDVFYRRLGMI
jgi:hypothetical protein